MKPRRVRKKIRQARTKMKLVKTKRDDSKITGIMWAVQIRKIFFERNVRIWKNFA